MTRDGGLGDHMPGRLAGKVALISGAGCIGPGWGNGRAAAVLFAREGAKVFAVDKDADSMTETVARVGNDGEIATHVCDVLDDAQVRDMTAACRKTFGRIDILVNNVGGSAAGGVAEMSEEIFDRQIDYNLKSVFLSCRHVIPVMIAQGGGAIVNTASASGTRYTGAPQIGYASAKAAVIQFSRVTAVQYAGNGIRVNTVIPGQMHTPWWKRGWPSSAPAATSRLCSNPASPAFRSVLWGTGAIRRPPYYFWPPMRPASSPAPKLW
jgi:NAD(P)-dependent dehydrogenase (short-subunit alcohol dehydrogenase family)